MRISVQVARAQYADAEYDVAMAQERYRLALKREQELRCALDRTRLCAERAKTTWENAVQSEQPTEEVKHHA